MKLALLNLPFDNNYGGNLQRYALMTILQRLGHDVWHINLRTLSKLPFYLKPYSYSKRIFQKYILGKKIPINIEAHDNLLNKQRCKETEIFYDKYINHTHECYNIYDVVNATKGQFDGIVVGSDQVWRKDMTRCLGVINYFLGFTKNWNIKRVAYAVSVGTSKPDYAQYDIKQLSHLFKSFDLVTVREESLLEYFKSINWVNPKASSVLDPTMLLDASDYDRLISCTETDSLTVGCIYCYVLDQNENLLSSIQKHSEAEKCDYIINDLSECLNPVSIEQWLRNIRDAKMVVTDSYHGCVFSLIFHKQFIYTGNPRRGNNRVQSLLTMFDIINTRQIDYDTFESKRMYCKSLSINLLKETLI